jgi:uncharacterized protein (DUF302 family)
MMSGRFFGAVALLWASLALLGGAAMAGTPEELRVSDTPVVMDHVTVETSTLYQLVTSRLEAEVKRLDERYRELLKENKIDELRVKLTQGLEPDGFMIHYVAAHGDWLALEGRRRQGIVYYVGNILSAAQMTKLNFSAALYAPLRLNVYENAHGGTTFEYDKPSTQFGQFHNADIAKVAQSLDDHLLRLIKKVSA